MVLRLFASLKSRIPILGIATGTREDEKYQGRCRPEPFDRLRTGSAERSGRSAPNRRAPSRSLRTAIVWSVRIGLLATGPAVFAVTEALDFSTSLEKTFSYQ